MKLKTNTSLLVLYVCYWPGLEDHSSGPGIVSRSLSRGESASLSSKHGFFLAREKSSSTLGVSRTASVSEGSCVKSATTRASDSRVSSSDIRVLGAVLSVERGERKVERNSRNKGSSYSSRERFLLRGEPVSRGTKRSTQDANHLHFGEMQPQTKLLLWTFRFFGTD